MIEKIIELRKLVQEKSPLVLNITNYVTMNNSANTLLAIGASPIMSKESEEMEDLAKICDSLVVNIGTIEQESRKAIMVALKEFNKLNKPVILDPVGAGASKYRNNIIKEILTNYKIDYIRGNGSEIIAIAGFESISKGVDSSENSLNALNAAKKLSDKYDCAVCISGETDIIVYKNRVGQIENGSKILTKVTALGCSSTATIGAYAALNVDKFEATLAGQSIMSLCGELAAKESTGTGSLQVNIIDKLYNIDACEITKELKVMVYQFPKKT